MKRDNADLIRLTTLFAAILGLLSSFARISSGQQLVAPDSKTVEQPGVITGRVASRGGEPISDGAVFVTPLGSSFMPKSVSVDSAGTFKFNVANAGLYRVWASVPGYTPDFSLTTDDSSRYFHAGDSLTLIMIKGGVITGKVTTAMNDPVVAANVRVLRVRDESGNLRQAVVSSRERLTDDRGIYRFYGLLPGAYIVSAGGPARFPGITLSGYDGDAPTYAPSSTRDTATEVIVGNGEEVTADNQYRAEAGHAISGTLSGMAQSQNQFSASGSVRLIDMRTRYEIALAPVNSAANFAFSFYGVADGEYELSGSQFVSPGNSWNSEGRRIKVQGADITGINLTLAPLGAIEGRLVLEDDPKVNCARRREAARLETIVFGRRYEPEAKPAAKSAAPALPEVPIPFTNAGAESIPDPNGGFSLRNLERGSYLIEPRAPSPAWYVRSITLGPVNTAARSNVARDGITLKSGERVSGLNITITEGAASVRGRVTVSEGQSLPAGMRIFLVPAEKDSAENVLRFFDARPESDGSFVITNIAPGRYWLLGRVADESDPSKVKRIRQNSTLRLQVLKEAESLKNEITLQPCQRLTDYDLRYPAVPADPRPKP